MHTAQTILLYGLLMTSSAEVIEKRHCTIKKLADRTNQRKDWKMQILIHENRLDETTFKLVDDLPNHSVMLTDERSQVTEAFADSVHSTQCARHRYQT